METTGGGILVETATSTASWTASRRCGTTPSGGGNLARPATTRSGSTTAFRRCYAARRARLMERMPDGVAIVLGATSTTGGEFFQNNDLMYFAGVEIPNAALLIDGRSKTSTLFFTITERGARNEGISLDLVRNAGSVTGIERVAPIEQLTPTLARLAGSGTVLYTSFKPEELAARELGREAHGAPEHHDPEPVGRAAHPRTAVREEPP